MRGIILTGLGIVAFLTISVAGPVAYTRHLNNRDIATPGKYVASHATGLNGYNQLAVFSDGSVELKFIQTYLLPAVF